MNANFEMQGLHEPIVVLEPISSVEALLLAAFIRYDSNVFSVSVDRFEDGRIQRVRLIAGQST